MSQHTVRTIATGEYSCTCGAVWDKDEGEECPASKSLTDKECAQCGEPTACGKILCENHCCAAPVSEAKAQGVVMPEHSNERGSDGELTYEAKAHNRCLDEVARLNAAPVQQVSVPDGWKLVPVEPTHEMISAGNDAAHACGCDLYQLTREVMNAYQAMLATAQAAPARGEACDLPTDLPRVISGCHRALVLVHAGRA